MAGKLMFAASAWALTIAATPVHAQVTRTQDGLVEGTSSDSVESWKGIPFAAPPLGPLRWQPPQPAARWHRILQANAYGHDCMQEPFPSDAAPLGTTPSEDCLTLNVWRPKARKSVRKLPVIVWIYGGGFVNGGSSPPTYSGVALARQGVVFVSFNYRLGRFGTFGHPRLTEQTGPDVPLGNYGYMDQIAALEWVHRNIAAFGGDPAAVTIMGESAGGMSVHALMTSPAVPGSLFQRAIIMSGGDATTASPTALADVEQTGIAFARARGIEANDPNTLAKLRALSADEVTDGLNLGKLFEPGPRTFSSPFADGRIAVHTDAAYSSGHFAHVPVMIGATSADIGGPNGFMIAGARRTAALIAGQGVPVYAYRFSYVAESLGEAGAKHATDIPFFLDTADIKYGPATSARDERMARTISAYIVNFAKYGHPNGPGLPAWKRYDGASNRVMNFSASGEAILETPR